MAFRFRNATQRAVLAIVNPQAIESLIEVVANKTYVLSLAVSEAMTIKAFTCDTLSGTCTIAVRINGVAITGLSAIAATAASLRTLATGANVATSGATIDMVVTANAAALDLAVVLEYDER